MSIRPKYQVARGLLGLTTFIGVLAVLAGVATAVSIQARLPTAIGIGVAINGLLVIAAAQMGSATLDTAIATRDTADAMLALLHTKSTEDPVAPRQPTGLRAMR